MIEEEKRGVCILMDDDVRFVTVCVSPTVRCTLEVRCS